MDLIDEGAGGGSIPESRTKDDIIEAPIPEARVKDDVVEPSRPSPTDAIRELMENPTFALLVALYGIAVAIRGWLGLNPANGDWLVDRWERDKAAERDRADRNMGGRDM